MRIPEGTSDVTVTMTPAVVRQETPTVQTPPPPVTTPTPTATYTGGSLTPHDGETTALQFGGETVVATDPFPDDESDAAEFLRHRPGLTQIASDADERILNLPNRTQRENASLDRASGVGRQTDGLQVYVRMRPSGGDGSIRMATLDPAADPRQALAFDPRPDKIASLQVVLDGGVRLEVRPTGKLTFPREFNARNLSDRDYAFLLQARDKGMIDDTHALQGLERLETEGGVGMSRADLVAQLPDDNPWLNAGAGIVGAVAGWGLSRMRAGLQVDHDPAYPLNLDKAHDQWGSGTLATENNTPVWASGGHFMHTAALASLLPGVVENLYTDVGRGLGSLVAGPRAGRESGAQDEALGQISQGVSRFVTDLSGQEGGSEALRTRLTKVLGNENRGPIDAYVTTVEKLATELRQPNLPEAHRSDLQTRISDATRQLVDDCGEMPSHFMHDLGSAAGSAFKSGYAVYLLYLSGEEFEVSKNPKAYLAAFNPFMSPVEVMTPHGGYGTRNDFRGDVTIGNMPGAAFQIVSQNLDKDGHMVVSASGPLGKGGGGDHTPASVPLPTTAEIYPDYASRVELRNDWGGLSFGSSVRSAIGQSGHKNRDILGQGSPVDATHEMSGGFHSMSWGVDPNSAVNRMKAIQPGTRMWSAGVHVNPGAMINGLSGTVLQNLQVGAEVTTGTAQGQHVDPANPHAAVMDGINGRQTLLHLRADLPLADLTGGVPNFQGENAWEDVGNYFSGGVNQFLENTRVGVSYGHNWGAVDPLQHVGAMTGGKFAVTSRTQLISLNGEESTMELLGKIGWGLLSGVFSYGTNSGAAAINSAFNGRQF